MSEGAIISSASPFNSTIWSVLKPSKYEWHFRVDYHNLNAMVQSNMTPYPIPTLLKLVIKCNQQQLHILLS